MQQLLWQLFHRLPGDDARTWLICHCLQAWYHYGAFCMRTKAYTRAQAAFREALSLEQQHAAAAAALCCLGLCIVQGKDGCDGPDAAALEWVEVLGHLLKDAADSAAALPWALLALGYRTQGE